MNINTFRQSLKTIADQYMGSDGSHDGLHLDRVWHNACIIIEHDKIEVDYLVVCAACYLHDIKQFRKDDVNNYKSSSLAADLALEILNNNFDCFSELQLDNISQCILSHSFSANIAPMTIEAKIVQDADRLDSLGAMGIARLFYTAGLLNTKLYCSEDHEYNDKKYALDHFYKKVLTLPDLLNTKHAKLLANQRIEHIKNYIEQFKLEANLDY